MFDSKTIYWGQKSGLIILFNLILVSSLVVFPQILRAETTAEEAKVARESALRDELAKVEADILANTKLLNSKRGESASISRDIQILTYQINQAKLKIRQKQIEIERLGGDITKKEVTITTLSNEIEEEKESLAELLRKTKDLDHISMSEVVLGNDTLSDFFVDIDSFNFIQANMHRSFAAMRDTQVEATKEKITLERRRTAEQDAKRVIEVETKKIQTAEAEKKRLLTISKSQEAGYGQIIAERERRRAAIRSELFRLRDSSSISFGEAVDMAILLSKKTGVRPAFALAILKQETNIGQNLGSCNRAGDPPERHWKAIMHPTRDQAPYLRIVTELGLDPETTPLSCAMSYGYGGAMGPAQFIPSTWEPYKARITAVTGNNPPNPWRPLDAFAASQLLLRDLGAAGGTYTAERTAALRYYAGGNWADPRNAFYGNSVMNLATQMQAQIDILQSS
ncbi:MAG: hypothetical protein AAB821_01050 [Patescibacteria group bacterium]